MLVNIRDIQKQQWVRFSIIIFILMLVVLGIFYLQNEHQPKEVKSEVTLETPFKSEEVNRYWQATMEREIEKASAKTLHLEQSMNELQKQYEKPNQDLQQSIDELKNKVNALENKLNQNTHAVDNNKQNAQSKNFHSLTGQIFPNVNEPNPQQTILPVHPIKVDDLNETSVKQQTSETYVPSGTFVKAVLLSGLDASAGVTSQTNPRPVLLRLLNMGHSPNRANSHLKDCFITGAGIGDVSSERAYIRLETLSCKTTKGEILDKQVFGTVVGPDGKDGIRGKIIWREGALLQRATIAGTLSGLGGGISQGFTTNQISPLGMTQSVEPNSILKMGVASGASNAMNKLAEYHIKRAEQYQPVIEIGAGTLVDVLFLKGFSWIEKKPEHDEKLPPPFESHQSNHSINLTQGAHDE